jgi:transposase
MKREILPVLDTEDKEMMERLLAGGQIKHKYAVRLQAVLNRAKGKGADETAEYLNIHFNTATQYVRRYNTGGIESLLRDKTRKPGKAPISEEIKNKLCDAVCREKPEHESRRSSRLPAKRFGISHNKTARILRERGIQPHRQTYCSFSTDPNFESKLRDAAGLYLNPPENAVILCADEKTRIQALERTQPVLFPGVKLPPEQTHDYYRHGTAALLPRWIC